jgi:hypothetical protein
LASLISFIRERNKTTPTWLKILIPILGVGGLGVAAVLAAVAAFVITGWLGQPVPVLGFEQTFAQPISFPHTVHAGSGQLGRINQDGVPLEALGLDCTFCHRTVTTQANAGVPPVAQCAFCHQAMGPGTSEPLTLLRHKAGIIGNDPSPINWRRVHRMPDHVRFVHEPHIRFLTANPSRIGNATAEVNNSPEAVKPALTCSTCHGDVAAMVQVKQVEPLKMGQCVNCHRDNGAPTDCTTCHH